MKCSVLLEDTCPGLQATVILDRMLKAQQGRFLLHSCYILSKNGLYQLLFQALSDAGYKALRSLSCSEFRLRPSGDISSIFLACITSNSFLLTQAIDLSAEMIFDHFYDCFICREPINSIQFFFFKPFCRFMLF